ncbi:transporter [Penicillium taxi]|uniref:transporter n=1 Tax=Penicillium taxi TaxID=168475 RepID=UPI002545068D|nr:transporter [Penicillium taxi]KAJ5888715.1 transporter [Penicillium taxi]
MGSETDPLVGSHGPTDSDSDLINEIYQSPEISESSKTPGVGTGFFLVAMLGAFIAYADDSFMISTHGEIASQFGQLSLGPWLIAAYNVGYVVTLPMYGRICDIHGYKRPLLSAYAVFALGCLIAGTADSIWMVFAGRFLSGAGGAGMVDLISVILNDIETLREVQILRSYLGMVTTAGVSAGGPLGGLIVDKLSWRWSFLIQIPFGLLCFGSTFWAFCPGSRLQELEENEGSKSYSRRRINITGMSLLTATLGGILALYQILGDDISAKVVAMFISTITLATLFGMNEKFLTSDPLIPLRLFKSNGIGVVYLIQFLIHFAFYGVCHSQASLHLQVP